jgi:hypothetical protein
MSGKDAVATHAAGDRFLSLAFPHNGGLSVTFSRLLERTFIRAPTHTARWRYGCPSMSQAAVSILRATILNAVAANMLSNYECMFRKAGITGSKPMLRTTELTVLAASAALKPTAPSTCGPTLDTLPPHQRSPTFLL